jgi:hypothetical protein
MSHTVWEPQCGHTKELCTKRQYVLCREGIILCHYFYLYPGIWLTSEENHRKPQCGQKVLGTFCSVNVATSLWAPLNGLMFPATFSQGLKTLWPSVMAWQQSMATTANGTVLKYVIISRERKCCKCYQPAPAFWKSFTFPLIYYPVTHVITSDGKAILASESLGLPNKCWWKNIHYVFGIYLGCEAV